jgi:hypothetical protein
VLSNHNSTYLKICVELIWIMVANSIIIANGNFGNLYGGRESLAQDHEVFVAELDET